jgi:hypothetical protein
MLIQFKQWLEHYADDLEIRTTWAKSTFHDQIAPNGKPAYQNFLNWFNKSQATSDNCQPRTYHHYTNHTFHTFDKSKIGTSTDHGFLGPGFYFFGFQPNATSPYGNKNLQVYLKVENPCRDSNLKKLLTQHFGDKDLTDQDEKQITQILQQAGYDGLLGPESVVYEPTQIKSTQNNGNFDPNNPNIYQ